MSAPRFVKLTSGPSDVWFNLSAVELIRRDPYRPSGSGGAVLVFPGESNVAHVNETPEQIIALLNGEVPR